MKKILFCLLIAGICGVAYSEARAEQITPLVSALMKQSNVTAEQADAQIETVFNLIQAELAAGREVRLRRFGRFFIQDRNARVGRNPKTGAQIDIPAKKYPKFDSSDILKESVNKVPPTL